MFHTIYIHWKNQKNYVYQGWKISNYNSDYFLFVVNANNWDLFRFNYQRTRPFCLNYRVDGIVTQIACDISLWSSFLASGIHLSTKNDNVVQGRKYKTKRNIFWQCRFICNLYLAFSISNLLFFVIIFKLIHFYVSC